MGLSKTIWAKPSEQLRHRQPDHPVMFFAPNVLQDLARRFVDGFPGLVTYAIKANPQAVVIENLAAAGVTAFNVASITEMRLIRRLAPAAMVHYNNPVRARHEITEAVALDIDSYAVDSRSELAKLIEQVPTGKEIAVRFNLSPRGPDETFGPKFGADPARAVELLRAVAQAGYRPALAFHIGTQCHDPMAWAVLIEQAGHIARQAGVKIARLNVGGGFPSHRLNGALPDLKAIFAQISTSTAAAFGDQAPDLVCEPGRAIVAECFTLAARVKAVRDDEDVFLNDGTYGNLDELPMIGIIDRTEVLSPEGELRTGEKRPRTLFGPTCDAIDRLPGQVDLPLSLCEGDYLLFYGMGAYSMATNTPFNGFGDVAIETVLMTR